MTQAVGPGFVGPHANADRRFAIPTLLFKANAVPYMQRIIAHHALERTNEQSRKGPGDG